MCAVLLVVLVVRDLTRVNTLLAGAVLAYAVVMGWLAYRGALLPTAERLPPAGLLAGQALMLLLITTTVTVSPKAWREIPLLHFFRWHSIRFPTGLIMVWLAYQGLLAPEFGWGAGIGEIVLGLWAAVYVLRPKSLREKAAMAWCATGLLDILVGMATALLTFQSPIQHFARAEKMVIMSTIPVILIPGFSMRIRYDALDPYAQSAAEGRFTVPVARTFSLTKWREAVELTIGGESRGKVVLVPDSLAAA